MNSKVLIVDFSIFSCILNSVIAWYIFDFETEVLFSELEVYINSLISLIVIVGLTSVLASLSAGKMLKQGKMELIEMSAGLKINIISGSKVVRLLVISVVACLVFSMMFIVVFKLNYSHEVTMLQAGIFNVAFCGFIGLLFTPMVAINRIVVIANR